MTTPQTSKTPDPAMKPPVQTKPQAFASGFTLSDAQHSQLETAVVVAAGLAPMLPKNAAIAVTIAAQLFQAVQTASSLGVDVSDEELEALFMADELQKAASAKARADKIAAGDDKDPKP